MSNLNVKKVLVEESAKNFTAGKEYEVFKEAGYTYIVDEFHDRLYFDLENKTYGYFSKKNVGSFSFGAWDLTIVPVIEKVKQVKEDEQTELEEVIMAEGNEVKIEEGLKFKVVEDLELEGAEYQEGEIYTSGERLNWHDGVDYAVDGENGETFFNLASLLKEAFEEGYFEVLEEATQVEVQADKVPRCITLKDIEEGKIKVGDRVACEEGSIYEVLEVDVLDASLPLRLTEYGWWGLVHEDMFRVQVEVTYLDFQEDREPLATYDSEEVEIVEEDGKLVVYSKENK